MKINLDLTQALRIKFLILWRKILTKETQNLDQWECKSPKINFLMKINPNLFFRTNINFSGKSSIRESIEIFRWWEHTSRFLKTKISSATRNDVPSFRFFIKSFRSNYHTISDEVTFSWHNLFCGTKYTAFQTWFLESEFRIKLLLFHSSKFLLKL